MAPPALPFLTACALLTAAGFSACSGGSGDSGVGSPEKGSPWKASPWKGSPWKGSPWKGSPRKEITPLKLEGVRNYLWAAQEGQAQEGAPQEGVRSGPGVGKRRDLGGYLRAASGSLSVKGEGHPLDAGAILKWTSWWRRGLAAHPKAVSRPAPAVEPPPQLKAPPLAVKPSAPVTPRPALPPPPPVQGAVHPQDAAVMLKVVSLWRNPASYTRDKFKLLATWNASRPCSKWYGVTCDNATGRVTGINLPGLTKGEDSVFYLTGHLPAGLGSLPELRTLILARNELEGDFEGEAYAYSGIPAMPPEWVQLRKLAHLDLSSNSFFGMGDYHIKMSAPAPVPQEVASLTSLTYLNLAQSGFGGPLPGNLTRLSLLQWCDLSISPFSSTYDAGGIDVSEAGYGKADAAILGKLTKLQSLTLVRSGVSLAKWSILSRLQQLEHLNLAGLEADLRRASWLGTLSRLVTLDLGEGFGYKEGSIPGWLSRLTRLEKLSLSPRIKIDVEEPTDANDVLTGSLPAWLGSLQRLSSLDLSANRLTGTLPASLFRPGRVLNLADNQLSGPLPATALHMMAQLVATAANGSAVKGYMDVSGNYLTGPCFSSTVAALKCPWRTRKRCGSRVARQLAGVAGNCLQQCDKIPVGNAPEQRSGDACYAFCGADRPSGPCDGHGVCSFEVNGGGNPDPPECACVKGFVAPTSKVGSCVPAPKLLV